MKTGFKIILYVCFLPVLIANSLFADVGRKIDDIVNRPSQKKVSFSIKVITADDGKVIYSHNAGRPLIPASNMKLIVAAAALRMLGPDFEYVTRAGLCDDALVVIGSGDPLLGDKKTDAAYNRKDTWIFDEITAHLKTKGVTNIRDIIVDSSIFDDQRVHPRWPVEQLNRDYACEVSGLNFNGNCIEITTKNNNGTVNIIAEPETDYVEIINKVLPITKGKSAVGAYRTNKPNRLVVKGKCKTAQGPFAVAIERPAVFFGFLLSEKLSRSQIKLEGHLLEKPVDINCDFIEIFSHTTSIADCLTRCNKDSFGLAAESLLKTIAARANPGNNKGSWADGQSLITEYLLELGIDRKEFVIDDGSGLSKDNRLSANVLANVLYAAYHSASWNIIRDSLAIGGVDGTIARYFKQEKYRGKILGKTGYINAVKSFSGICFTDKKAFIFSIITNNANAKTRGAINDIVKAIIDSQQVKNPDS